jgi:hypothetical protein
MNHLNRRLFFQTAGAGLILPLIGRTNVLAQPAEDPILQHIFTEAVRLARELQQQGLRAETLGALATNFRLHAAHVRANKIDALITARLQRLVRKQGRDQLIDRVVGSSHEQMRGLEALGLDQLHLDPPSREAAERALNRLLLGNALEPLLRQAAEASEVFRGRLVKLAVPGGGVRVQNVGPGDCTAFRQVCIVMIPLAALTCLLAPFQPELIPLCPLLTVQAQTACLIANLGGC